MSILPRSFANTANLFVSPFFVRRLFVGLFILGCLMMVDRFHVRELLLAGPLLVIAFTAFLLGLPLWPIALSLGFLGAGMFFYFLTVVLALWTFVRFQKRPKLAPGEARTFQIKHSEVRSKISFGFAWQMTLCAPDKPRAAAEAIARIQSISALEGSLAFFIAQVALLGYFFGVGILARISFKGSTTPLGITTLLASVSALFLAPLVLKSFCRLTSGLEAFQKSV